MFVCATHSYIYTRIMRIRRGKNGLKPVGGRSDRCRSGRYGRRCQEEKFVEIKKCIMLPTYIFIKSKTVLQVKSLVLTVLILEVRGMEV